MKGLLLELDRADPLILDFQLPELRNKFLLLRSYPACDRLLEHSDLGYRLIRFMVPASVQFGVVTSMPEKEHPPLLFPQQ